MLEADDLFPVFTGLQMAGDFAPGWISLQDAVSLGDSGVGRDGREGSVNENIMLNALLEVH